ncbi:uncharacterized protein LOC118203993 [Stegodyphus dumicola]|uniref:uncharacterized protein LOC118203993 n=1 Tax=Stegodyphus dumicola TaxID=202533 RepID=UPI0015AE4380|nr:uncharacterized protein LOC118203993 [Stegodyphus dumicola]XP_035232207.1 uncharacterized protein LOC118203993 [Stegodyphus dumicola]
MMMIFYVTMAAIMTISVSADQWGPETIYFEEKATDICSSWMPCGWYTYKTTDYYSEKQYKGPCECPDNTVCKQYRHNLFISAYEYRCSPLKNEVDSAFQEESKNNIGHEDDSTPQDAVVELMSNVEELVLKMKQLSTVVQQFISVIKEAEIFL